MDVRLSGEQLALRESAARVVDQLGPRAVGQLDDEERAAKLDAAVHASGWRDLRTADGDRGPLASAVETALVGEELGRGLADASFLGPTLAAELRRLAGAAPATSLETVALRSDLSAAAEVADDVVEAGAVAVDAGGASTALVLVTTPDGFEPATVQLDTATANVDLTRPVAAVGVGPITPLAGLTRSLSAADLDRWTALGLALTCADLVGVMRGAVQLARDHAASRQQFGVTVGSFQAVQHLLADAYVSTEGSASVALHAAWAVDAIAPDDALGAAALAKAYCARAARDVCETGIQVHGGIGNTWECLAHVFLRRALLSIDLFGGVGPSLERVLDHHGVGAGHGLR